MEYRANRHAAPIDRRPRVVTLARSQAKPVPPWIVAGFGLSAAWFAAVVTLLHFIP